MSRNSITPSRAFLTMGVRVLTTGGSPLGPGRQSRTPHAQLATGLGEPTSSTRHMRQLPAIDSRSWKQKRGISAPAASHACNSVYSGGTSISVPSTTILVMSLPAPPPGPAHDVVSTHDPCASLLGFKPLDPLGRSVDPRFQLLVADMRVRGDAQSMGRNLVEILHTGLHLFERSALRILFRPNLAQQ